MRESTECRVDLLSEFVDGHLDRSSSEAIDTHIQSCSDCWLLVEELRSVVSAAAALPEQGPETDLWPAILEGVSESTMIELPTERTTVEYTPPNLRAAPARGGVFLTNGQLAAAAAAVILMVGGSWIARTGMSSEPTVATIESPAEVGMVRTASLDDVGGSQFARQIQELEEVFGQARPQLDPNTVRILEKNLALIDQAIRESVEALVLDPDNEFVEDYLRRSYERKVDYLRGATALLALAEE